MKYIDFKRTVNVHWAWMYWLIVLVVAAAFFSLATWIIASTSVDSLVNTSNRIGVRTMHIFVSAFAIVWFLLAAIKIEEEIDAWRVDDKYLEMLSTVDDLPDCGEPLVFLKERLIAQKMQLTYGDLFKFFREQDNVIEAERQRAALAGFITPPGAAKLLQEWDI